ncbi:MAG: tetratricopeptide repeat protein [Deltaproteobacteria bacterium]|nr:tetratricopeptide repeat protein [Deltaproteobacteria bacterium]
MGWLVYLVAGFFAAAVPGPGLWPVVFPMLPPAGAAPQDGSQTGDFEGPGQAQMRLAGHLLKARNQEVARAEAAIAALMPVVRAVAAAEKEKDKAGLREALGKLGGKPLDEAQAALLEAVSLEGRRLRMVRKAVEVAAAARKSVPGVDPRLVAALDEHVKSGRAGERAETRFRAYRYLASGLVAFLDDDPPTAVARMKAATDAGPDLAPAWVYLGSFYFLVQKVELAVEAWKKALALDPSNEAVRRAIKDYELRKKKRK